MKKRVVFAAVLALFLNMGIGASMVSFYVIETGLSENITNVRHSELWENAFLDIFFDAGHIVSNAPILRLEHKVNGNILRMVDMQDARDSGVEFVLIAQLDYTDDLRAPDEISFFIYKVTPQEKILDRTITPKSFRTTNDEYNDIKAVVRGLVPYVGR